MYLGTASYNKVAVETADQKTLILLCYDEAIRALKMGRDCFYKKKFEDKFDYFTRAQDFISELSTGLNLEAGGEIARNLRTLYDFSIKTITDADLKKDMKLIDKIITILSELRSAWAEIDFRPPIEVVGGHPYQAPKVAARGLAV